MLKRYKQYALLVFFAATVMGMFSQYISAMFGQEDIFPNNTSSLIRAIIKEKKDEVVRLIKLGEDINQTDQKCRRTPLHWIMFEMNGDPELVKMLLENGAEPDICDKDGYTAFAYAVKKGCFEAAKILLSKNVDINKTFGLFEETLLHILASSCADETVCEPVRFLLINNANPELRDKLWKMTPFEMAIDCGNSKIVSLFFDQMVTKIKPDLNVKIGLDKRKESILQRAISSNLLFESFKILVEQGADIDESVVWDGKLYTLHEWAERHGTKQIANYLKSFGPKKELEVAVRKNAPVKQLEELANKIYLLDPSFVKKFSALAYFKTNVESFPKKLTGLFDRKTGTSMTPGAAKLLGVKPLNGLKKADSPDMRIYFKLWYEPAVNVKKHKLDGLTSQENVKKIKKNVSAILPAVAGLTLGDK